MKEKIVTFAHTEYHLLLFINLLINEEEKGIVNDHILYVRGQNGFRIPKNLNFSYLSVDVRLSAEKFKEDSPLNHDSKILLDTLLSIQPNKFIFFQEQDLLSHILADRWKQKYNTAIFLYQDGLKPYNILKYNSLGLMKLHYKYNLWMKRNGFSIHSWFSPLWSHRYAYMKNIDEVYLTFPEAYVNWNKKNVKKIEFLNYEKLKIQLEKVFNWNDNLLPQKEGIIFYLSQPMRDDGTIEDAFIQKLVESFPKHEIYLKLHPNIQQHKIDIYNKNANLTIITARIPAELFIMQLSKSLVISMNSTSMFINNINCKFYYIHEVFKNDIKRLSRYDIKVHPAPHIHLAKKIEDITF